MTEPSVFFSRCRPQSSDPIDLVVRERRVFIGWPACRSDVQPKRGNLRDWIIDLRCPDNEWDQHYAHFDKKERVQYQKNRNFIREISSGAIALVPRPSLGTVYAGRVIKPFEQLDDPPWGDEYLRIRKEQGHSIENEFSHLADVAFCCEVDQFRPIPFPLIPAWIRRSLLGRSTYGRISPPLTGIGLEPYALLDALIDNPTRAAYAWTGEVDEVERRLVDGVGPNAFEHLCVALLQLEHPEHVWAHVGGSGDGGIDGIGADALGQVVGLLQSKWAYWGDDVFVGSQESGDSPRQILAALLHDPSVRLRQGIEFWSRDLIARLVVKHAAKLPQALSLRIKASASELGD